MTDLHLRAPRPPAGAVASEEVRVSVLVPAYNAAATLGDALESVLTQRPPVAQVVVSDDGSEDDTPAVVAGFGDRVHVTRGPNAGLATARNRAAAVATGTHLGLLDADDVWLPGRSAAIVGAATARPDLDIITTDAFVTREGVRDEDTYYATRTWPDGDQVMAILTGNFIFGAAAIRREAFQRVGGYSAGARFTEDWDLWIRMLVRGSRAGLVEQPLYEYRRHDASITSRKVDLGLGVLRALERARQLPLTTEQLRRLGETEAAWRVNVARHALGSGDERAGALLLRGLVHRSVRLEDRARLVVAAWRGRGR